VIFDSAVESLTGQLTLFFYFSHIKGKPSHKIVSDGKSPKFPVKSKRGIVR
jgi:hypothetical protein